MNDKQLHDLFEAQDTTPDESAKRAAITASLQVFQQAPTGHQQAPEQSKPDNDQGFWYWLRQTVIQALNGVNTMSKRLVISGAVATVFTGALAVTFFTLLNSDVSNQLKEIEQEITTDSATVADLRTPSSASANLQLEETTEVHGLVAEPEMAIARPRAESDVADFSGSDSSPFYSAAPEALSARLKASPIREMAGVTDLHQVARGVRPGSIYQLR